MGIGKNLGVRAPKGRSVDECTRKVWRIHATWMNPEKNTLSETSQLQMHKFCTILLKCNYINSQKQKGEWWLFNLTPAFSKGRRKEQEIAVQCVYIVIQDEKSLEICCTTVLCIFSNNVLYTSLRGRPYFMCFSQWLGNFKMWSWGNLY